MIDVKGNHIFIRHLDRREVFRKENIMADNKVTKAA